MPTLNEIVAEYMAGLQDGQPLSREKILADNSQLVNVLRAFFDELDRLKLGATTGNRSASQLTQHFDAEPHRFGDELSPENRERIRRYLHQSPEPLPSTLQNSSHADATASNSIGPYKLLQQLGVGGMGQVWMAEQERPIRRRVAIKLIKAGMDSKQVVARFEAERQALALMDHQNIAKVLDAGTTSDQQPYFVMELVQGIPLTKYCDQNRLNIRERLKLFVQVCNAVQHAHQKGIVHRDLKPSNILVTLYDGHPVPKVIDFGLAKALQHQVKLTDRTLFTEFGQVVGTIQYMSPEQTEMNALDVDTRTDIYSLGVVLYELLTGSTPIDTKALEDQAIFKVLEKIREADPPPPSRRLSESGKAIQGISLQRKIEAVALSKMLRGDLDWVVMKALDKDRSRRYGTADNFAEDIERFLAGDVVAARPPSLDYRLGKFVRRNRSLVISTVAVVSLLLAATLISVLFAVRADEARREAEYERTKADRQRKVAELAAERATQAETLAEAEAARASQAQAETTATLARSNFRLAQYRWRDGRFLEANRLLHSVPPEHRKLEWHVSRRIFEGSDVTMYGPETAFSKIVFNAEGSQILSLGLGPEVKPYVLHVGQWDSVQGLQVGSQSMPTSYYMACAALDSEKQLAVMGLQDGTVQLWGFQSNEPAVTLGKHDSATLIVEVSPDGTRAASVARDGVVKVWDLATKQLLSSLAGDVQGLVGLLFHPAGNALLAADRDGKILLWDTNNWRVISSLVTGEQLNCISVSPDGRRIATAHGSQIKLWDLIAQRELASLSHSDSIRTLRFSPDGSRLASGSDDATIKVFDVARGVELFNYRGHVSTVENLTFSPDGSRLASADGYSIKLWDMKTGRQDVTVGSHDNFRRKVHLSPDGARLATRTFTGIEIWDTKSLLLVRTIEHKFDPFAHELLRFSSDNTQLIYATSAGGILRWNLSTGEQTGAMTLPYAPEIIDISPSGQRIATATLDGIVQVWSFPEGQKILTIEATDKEANGAPHSIGALALSDDRILSVGEREGPRIWDLKSGRLQRKLVKNEWFGTATAVAFSVDGSLAYVQNGLVGETAVWNVHSGKIINSFTTDPVSVDAVYPLVDSTRFASLNGGHLYWWDSGSREELLVYPTSLSQDFIMPGNWSTGLAISKRGDLMATGGTPWDTHDSLLQVWDTAHGPEPIELVGHRGFPTEFAFSAAGDLYSKGETVDGEEKFRWDLSTLQHTPVESFPRELTFKYKSEHGTLVAYGHEKNIMVLDMERLNSPEVQAYRRTKATFSPAWHQHQADQAHANGDWYAAALHSAWALSAEPKDIASHYILRKSLEAWNTEMQNSSASGDAMQSLCADLARHPRIHKLPEPNLEITIDDVEFESRLEEALTRSIDMASQRPSLVRLTEEDETYCRFVYDEELLQKVNVGMGRYSKAFENLLEEFKTTKEPTIFEQYLQHEKTEALARQVHKQMLRSNPSGQATLQDVEPFVPKQLQEILAEPLKEQVPKADLPDMVGHAWRNLSSQTTDDYTMASWVFYLDQQDSLLIRKRSLFDLAKMAAQQQPSIATHTLLGAIHFSRQEHRQAIDALTEARKLAANSAAELRDRSIAAAFLALSHQQLGETERAEPYRQEFLQHYEELRKTWANSYPRDFCDLSFLNQQMDKTFPKR